MSDFFGLLSGVSAILLALLVAGGHDRTAVAVGILTPWLVLMAFFWAIKERRP